MQRKADAILALGISTDPRLFGPRVRKAVRLYKQGVAPSVIFSGRFWGGIRRNLKSTESRKMAQYAASLGLSKSAILLEEKSLNTIGNLYFTKKEILVPRRIRRLVIVTHRAHAAKVEYLARKVLGSGYRLSFELDDLQSGFTHSGVSELRRHFSSIRNGDDKAILRKLRTHEYYRRHRTFE